MSLSIPSHAAIAAAGLARFTHWPAGPGGMAAPVPVEPTPALSPTPPDLNTLLHQAQPITLAEMDGVALLNRVDTKFMLSAGQLRAALAAVGDAYRVLQIGQTRVHAYRTLYFDSPGLDLYLHHHAGRGNRYKVRSRQYLQSQTAFLEVKQKSKGRTKKSRIGTHEFLTDLAADAHAFVHQAVPGGLPLMPVLFNAFHRVTLVNLQETERLTLDLDIRFTDFATDRTVGLDGLAVAEVKQDGRGPKSDFVECMRRLGVRPAGFSKYCVGVALLRPDVKRNRFKRVLGQVGKLLTAPAGCEAVSRFAVA